MGLRGLRRCNRRPQCIRLLVRGSKAVGGLLRLPGTLLRPRMAFKGETRLRVQGVRIDGWSLAHTHADGGPSCSLRIMPDLFYRGKKGATPGSPGPWPGMPPGLRPHPLPTQPSADSATSHNHLRRAEAACGTPHSSLRP